MNKPSYNFINLKPLKYAVKCNTKVVIPEGAVGVKCAFRQSHLKRWDDATQKLVPMNVYLYKGKLYHI